MFALNVAKNITFHVGIARFIVIVSAEHSCEGFVS
jgi:hypothetical protein